MTLRIRDPDAFQKVASGVQSALLSVAIVVGGVWTIYVFKAKLDIDSAEAQLRVSRAQLQATEAQIEKSQRELLELTNLELSIAASTVRPRRSSMWQISGTIRIRNLGTKVAIIELPPKTLQVLHGADVVAGLKQVRGLGLQTRMAPG